MRDCHVPVRLQRDTGSEYGADQVDAGDDDDGHDDLRGLADPQEREDVDVQHKNRHLAET